ncbi:hypothetical protein [Thiomicrorhabdus cannonii]|uniref:hypothetical protein n=1 Tax=Thiomicrorhabdus cannonii TaxID=2748011 RepID=UPI0015B88ABD|nr:hypothetical protein [Thiomicrorhabdus cannonii]
MDRIDYTDWNKRTYKPPTDIEATNSKLDPTKVEQTKRLNEQKERIRDKQEPWDALEEI